MVLCCCCVRKRKSARNTEECSINLEEPESDGTENVAFVQGASIDVPELPESPVKKADLLSYIEDHQKDLNKYRAEFNALPGSGIKPFAVGRKHADKNRYVNIIPFDENRICLKECESKSDYINASFINGYKKEKAYIAAQGPMDHTVNEFWQMIWEQNCSRIVMVTNIFEGTKVKCSRYWPTDEEKNELTYGHIKVKLVEATTSPDYIVRKLEVQHIKGEESRAIYQFHFISWLDQDVPDTSTSVLKFYKLSFLPSEAYPLLAGPLLIHCSAGVGRTGTLIALDLLIQQVQDKDKDTVDIPKCVENLRRQRANMVQSTGQYVFIHHALLEYVQLGNVEIEKDDFLSTCEDLKKSEDRRKPGFYNQQYSVLNALRPEFQPFRFSIAKFESNLAKNRNPAILPADDLIPNLLPLEDGQEPYINAVYVQVFEQPKSHIATQMPLPDTVDDFWNLVYANHSSIIVMLNDMPDTSEQYWPDDGKTLISRDIEVTTVGEVSKTDNIQVVDLRLFRAEKQKKPSKKASKNRPKSIADRPTTDMKYSNAAENIYSQTLPPSSGENSGIRKVKLIRVLDWASDSAVPKDKTTLLDVYQKVESYREMNSEKRVVVHCLYGAERTGLFCALVGVLKKIERDNIVDVFNSVKRVWRTRPEFISKKEHYKYLYMLVHKYIRVQNVVKVEPQPSANSEENEDDVYMNASEQL